MAYATTGDLASRWRSLSPAEEHRASALLDDASAIVDAEVPALARAVLTDEAKAALAVATVCAMVRRVMQAGAFEGVSATQESASGLSQSLTFANPAGALYLSKAERSRLRGRRGGTAGNVDLLA